MMPIKQCCRCGIPKSVLEFNKAKRGLHGAHSICKECKKLYMKQYNESGKLKISKQKYKNTKNGAAKIKAYIKSDKNKELQKQYRESPAGRVTCTAKLAKYRACKKQAFLPWAPEKELQSVYKNCPKAYEVDHIIPLQNDAVCGLHLPWNLQYLTKEQNAVKSNSFDGTYDNESWKNE